MRKNIILALGLLLTVTMSAANRTVDEAAAIAARFSSDKARLSSAQAPARHSIGAQKPELAFTQFKPASDEAAFYVFNTSTTDGGFVIVSADDRIADILAYTDGPAFDEANMNPNMRWWMDATAQRVAHADTDHIHPVSATHPNTPVAPLLGDIEWGQTAPYNLLCPMEGEHRTVTGCVATAAAQIMRYWRWPLQGTGSHSYQWQGQMLTADFGATFYDWDNMPANYDLYETDEEEEAVSTLLYQLGVAVNMNYSYDGSGSFTSDLADALPNYFSYKANLGFRTDEDYLAIINADLDHARPVYISGTAGESAAEGHAFVCDGRDAKGYLHINWGWDGMNNGYFDFENLGGFGYGIELIYGIEPDIAEEVPVQDIAVSPVSVTLKQGEKTQLQLVVTPTYATRHTATWATDNASVATVDGIGMVTAHSTGTAHITAAMDGYTAVATVTVSEFIYAPPHFELVTNENDIHYGDELIIVDPENSVAMSLISNKASRLVENVEAVPVTIVDNAINLDEFSEASIFTYYYDSDYAVLVNQQGNYLSAGGPNRLGWEQDGWHWEFSIGADGAVSMQSSDLGSSNKTNYLGYSSSQKEFIYNRKTSISLPRLYRRCDEASADTDYSITDLRVNTDDLHVTIDWKTKAPFCRMEIWDQYTGTMFYQTQLKGPGSYTFQYDFPASGKYRYCIIPLTASGSDDYHTTSGFITVASPADYIPTDLEVFVDGYEATFLWSAIAPAPYYQLQILIDGEVAFDEYVSDMGVIYTFIRQFNATWRVRAIDTHGEPLSEFVDGGTFAITGSADDPKNLTATTTDGYTYTLAWEAGPRDARTILELDIEIDGNLYVYKVIDNVSSPYVKELSMNGRYEWNIRTYDADGHFISRADGPSFKVVAPDYSVTNLRADVNNNQVTITWDGLAPNHQVTITNSKGEVKYQDITTEHSIPYNTVIPGTYTVTVIPVNADYYTLDEYTATTRFVIDGDDAPQITDTHLEFDGTVIYFCWDGPENTCYNLQILYDGQLIGSYLVRALSGGINFAGLEGETFSWRVCICDGEGNPLSDFVDGGTFTVGAEPAPQTSSVRVHIADNCTMNSSAGMWLWWWPEGYEGSCVPLAAEGDGWYSATIDVPENTPIAALVVNRDVSSYGWDGSSQTIDTPIFATSSTDFAIGEYDASTGKWDIYAVPEGAFTKAFLPHDLSVTTTDGYNNVVMEWESGDCATILWELLKDGEEYQCSLTADGSHMATIDEAGTYSWRVCAADDQWRPLSDYVYGESFTYSGDQPGPVQPTGLSVTTTDGFHYTFCWQEAPTAAKHRVSLFFNIGDTPYMLNYYSATSPLKVEMFQSGEFSWKVYAEDADDNIIGIADGGSFTVALPGSMLTGVNPIVADDRNVVILWQGLAERYQLTVYDAEWNTVVDNMVQGFTYIAQLPSDGLYTIVIVPVTADGYTIDEFTVSIPLTISDTAVRPKQADRIPVKQLRDGRIVIVRDGKTFNVQGIEQE